MFRRVMFALMGFPLLINSFFSFMDILPYSNIYLMWNNKVLEITASEKIEIQDEITSMLENAKFDASRNVISAEEFNEETETGYFLVFEFDGMCEINGLEFNELAVKVCEECKSFEIYRGINGVYGGRSFYLETEKTSKNLYEIIENIRQDHSEEEFKERVIMSAYEDVQNEYENGEFNQDRNAQNLDEKLEVRNSRPLLRKGIFRHNRFSQKIGGKKRSIYFEETIEDDLDSDNLVEQNEILENENIEQNYQKIDENDENLGKNQELMLISCYFNENIV